MREMNIIENFRNQLIHDYGYAENDIHLEERIQGTQLRPDIVVYKDDRPYIVIEIKARYAHKDFSDKYIKQVYKYAKALNVEYFAISTLDITNAFRLDNNKIVSIPNIPNKNDEIQTEYYINNYKKLVHLFSEIRDILKGGGKRDDFSIISQFNKLLLIKYFTEKQNRKLIENREYINLKEFNHIYYDVIKKYNIIEDNYKPDLNEDEFYKIIDLLKYIKLIELKNIDKIYLESFIKPLKSELILTEEIDALIKKINISQDLLIINSGFGQLSSNYDYIHNIENNRIKIETTKILQLIKGLRQEFYNGEILDTDLTGKNFKNILVVPPINLKVKGYNEFEIEREKKAKDYSCLVIEKSLQLLQDNGFLFIVLPNSILSNIGFSNSRNFISNNFNIIGITSFKDSTFQHSNILTSLIILQKKDKQYPQQNPIYFSELLFDTEIERIASEVNQVIVGNYSVDSLLLNFNDLKDRWDYHYYQKVFLQLENKISGTKHINIKNYVTIFRGSNLGNNNLGECPLITVGSIEDGKINKSKLSLVTEEDSFKNSRGQVLKNDLVITVVGKYPKCALVTSEFEGSNTNAGIVILRPINEEIYMKHLYEYFNSGLGQVLLYRGITYTSTVPILTQSEIEKIPIVFEGDIDSFLDDIPELKDMFTSEVLNNSRHSSLSKEECQERINIEIENVKRKIEANHNNSLDEFKSKFNLIDNEDNIFSLFGLKGDVFGVDVIRSFIKLDDLTNIETDKQNFQREVDETHNNELINFLKEGKYKFFPEIVLGIKDIDDLKSKDYLFEEIIEQNSGITKISFNNKKVFDSIEVLDGRHRIESIKKYLDNESTNKQDTVSVVFILLDESQTTDLLDKAIFYNLNAKARVLEPIDYLNLLSHDEDDKLKELNITNINIFKFFKENKDFLFNGQKEKIILSKCICLTDYLVDSFEDEQIEKIKSKILNVFKYMNKRILDKYNIELKTKIYMLIIYLLSTKIHESSEKINKFIEKELNGFIEWLKISNLMDSLKDIDDLKDFYMTYEKTYIPKSRKIYISMPYHKETEWTYYIVKDIVNEISTNLHIKIDLIRTDQQTYGIHTGISETVYNEIESCDLMIADLTGDNVNVFNEVGFKMGIDKAQKLSETQIIFLVNSKCYYEERLENSSFVENEYKVSGKILKNSSNDVPFNLRGIKHIEFHTSHYLKAELYKELEQYFNYYKISKVSK